MTTTTIADEGQQAQEVHLNLLTGSLLINGKPLGRLPRNITAHPLYARTFGSVSLVHVSSGKPILIIAYLRKFLTLFLPICLVQNLLLGL